MATYIRQFSAEWANEITGEQFVPTMLSVPSGARIRGTGVITYDQAAPPAFFQLASVFDVVVEGLTFDGKDATVAFDIDGTASDITFVNCTFKDCTIGVDIDGTDANNEVDGVSFIGCRFVSNTTDVDADHVANLEFAGCEVSTLIVDNETIPPTEAGNYTSATVYGKIVTREVTLGSQAVAITDTGGASGGHGTHSLLTLPAQHVLILGAFLDVAVTASGGVAADAAVDVAVGTAAETANATLDSTQADIVGSTDMDLTDSDGSASATSAGVDNVDATGGTQALHLNFGVPDADITANGSLAVTGTFRVSYIVLGAP